MRKTMIVLMVAAIMVPAAAHATDQRVWLMVNGGFGAYDMSELNTEITAYNDANAGSGLSYPLVERGTSFGLAIGVDQQHGWTYGIGLDRLHAVTKAGDASGSLEYQLTANAWHLFGEHALGTPGRISYVVGGAVGLIAESGNLIQSVPDTEPSKYKLTGSSPMFAAHTGASWWTSPRFAVVATVGYRYARVHELKLEGGSMITFNGEALALDYSGPYVRLGFKFAGKDVAD